MSESAAPSAEPRLDVRVWRRLRRDQWLAILLPPTLFALLRPETYGQIPNPLDPVFYTGLSINFDTITATLNDRFYFIARWSAYLPQRLFTGLFGVLAGRMLWRWVLAWLVLSALFRFGRRWYWTFGQQLLIGTLALTLPIFLRSFMSDYVEYTVLGLGTVLSAVALSPPRRTDGPATVVRGLVLGVLVGLIVVANPAGIVMCALAVLAGLMAQADRPSWSDRAARRGLAARSALLVASIGVGSAFTVAAGWVLFRVVYSQPNLYGSTLEAISKIGNDPLKSPRLEWLGSFTWLYGTPILVAATLIVAARPPAGKHRFQIRLRAAEWAVLGLATAQYAYQWIDQFVRGGPGLELSYYFVYALPSTLLVLAVFVERCAQRLRWERAVALAAAWLVLVYWGGSLPIELPRAGGFAVLAAVVLGSCALLARRSAGLVGMTIAGFVLATQVVAPRYDPSAYHLYNVSPRLDELFLPSPTHAERTLSEVIWLRGVLGDAPSIEEAAFIPTGGWLSDSNYVAGLFGPQPTRRLLFVDDAIAPTPQTAFEIANGSRPFIAVLGDPNAVDTAVQQLRKSFPEAVVELDKRHSDGLGMRVVYLWVPHRSRLPLVWSGTWLYAQGGSPRAGALVAPAGKSGLVAYGPYLPMDPGRYAATLRYTSAVPRSELAGSVDVLVNGNEVRESLNLDGTDATAGTATIEFEVRGPGERIEVRSSSTGAGEFGVESLRIAEVP